LSAPAATAPFLAGAAVLAVAGAAKLWRPDDTARALQVAGLPGHRRLVRAGAAVELVVGGAAVAAPGRWTAALVAAAYAAFTGFVAVALAKKWPLSSCGCFGRLDARPGYPHLLLDAGALIAAVLWAVEGSTRSGGPFVQSLFGPTPWHGLPLGLVTVVIAGLAYLVWTNPVARTRA
jgi:hypothetical protein